MDSTIKALLAKTWKNESADLATGTHWIDETLTIRLTGTVEKLGDELAALTVSISLIPTLALFWEKAGIARDAALNMLRQALTKAMDKEVKEDAAIKERIKDVEKAVRAICQELIADLPKMRRDGKALIDGLRVEVVAGVAEAELMAA